jgi:hypothetical protein
VPSEPFKPSYKAGAWQRHPIPPQPSVVDFPSQPTGLPAPDLLDWSHLTTAIQHQPQQQQQTNVPQPPQQSVFEPQMCYSSASFYHTASQFVPEPPTPLSSGNGGASVWDSMTTVEAEPSISLLQSTSSQRSDTSGASSLDLCAFDGPGLMQWAPPAPQAIPTSSAQPQQQQQAQSWGSMCSISTTASGTTGTGTEASGVVSCADDDDYLFGDNADDDCCFGGLASEASTDFSDIMGLDDVRDMLYLLQDPVTANAPSFLETAPVH